MHLLIDGNNLLPLIPKLNWLETAIQKQLGLAALLKDYRISKNLKITLFFDGGECQAIKKTTLNGIPVIFSGSEHSADKVMLDFVQNRPGLVLVSNDSALCRQAESKGAKSISATYLAGNLNLAHDGEDNSGWNFSTRKKGPSHRLSKAKRHKFRLG